MWTYQLQRLDDRCLGLFRFVSVWPGNADTGLNRLLLMDRGAVA